MIRNIKYKAFFPTKMQNLKKNPSNYYKNKGGSENAHCVLVCGNTVFVKVTYTQFLFRNITDSTLEDSISLDSSSGPKGMRTRLLKYFANKTCLRGPVFLS